MQSNFSTPLNGEKMFELVTAIGRMHSLRDPLVASLVEQGIGPAQVHALMWLRTDGPLAMGMVANRCGVTDKTVTGIVDRLERDGLVVRERRDTDRRVVQVALSEAGKKLSEQIYKNMVQRFSMMLGFLDEKDRQDLFRILNHFVERLSAIEAKPNGSSV